MRSEKEIRKRIDQCERTLLESNNSWNYPDGHRNDSKCILAEIRALTWALETPPTDPLSDHEIRALRRLLQDTQP